ncbi:MAG: transcription antitermination factor NusB, partial [Candidatus Nanopelagicales bacterium]
SGSSAPRAGAPRQSAPTQRPPARVDPARMAALDLLRDVELDGAYANIAWPRILAHHRLSGRDAGFATELGYGTLRWRGRHDAILATCVDRGLGALQPELLNALRLGVHQLHEMRVGDHAAVGETVELVRAAINPGAAGLANAVLRKVARGGTAQQWVEHLVATGTVPDLVLDPIGHLATALSHPAWIVSAIHDALASSKPERTWADTARELAADNAAGSVTLVARTLERGDLLDQLQDAGVTSRPGALSRLAVRVQAVNPGSLPQVATGAAGVQDEGSQVVALILADAPIEGPDSYWLDMCAGPGGKAAVLAGQVAGRGGTLRAVELHPHRADLVRASLRPIRGRHEVQVADATRADIGTGYDRVLLDAPCTGLGALRRRPEARWRRSAEDLAELTDLQRRLLARALTVVRPGGLVLYVTCSAHLAETDAVVATAERSGGTVLPLAEVPGLDLPDDALAGPFLRLWPAAHDTDGMFAALIRRD